MQKVYSNYKFKKSVKIKFLKDFLNLSELLNIDYFTFSKANLANK